MKEEINFIHLDDTDVVCSHCEVIHEVVHGLNSPSYWCGNSFISIEEGDIIISNGMRLIVIDITTIPPKFREDK